MSLTHYEKVRTYTTLGTSLGGMKWNVLNVIYAGGGWSLYILAEDETASSVRVVVRSVTVKKRRGISGDLWSRKRGRPSVHHKSSIRQRRLCLCLHQDLKCSRLISACGEWYSARIVPPSLYLHSADTPSASDTRRI